ncbi:MAG TPA: thiamine pyrophosphate-dependent enzyme [Actinomycetota bacterium]|nr:thiamine pyrophosphate-dependent enzyme [Actinomycetota bacterium]
MAEETLRIIGDGQEQRDSPPPEELTEKDLVALYRSLVILRTFDERAVSLQRQGRLGTYAMYWGEEATHAGPLYACNDTDWLFPTYRQNSIGVLRGVKASIILAWWRGYGGALGFYQVREHRVAPICVPIATHLPHAVGLSWAAKKRGDGICALTWLGDGATSEGDFHEAMNFASVFKTPTVLFCVNNQWAISTPVSRQTATATLVEKRAAYGMPGLRVDGFDVLACWKATKDALEHARAGGGPTFIEAVCYRIGPHGTADDPRLYRDETESQRYRALEPLGRYRGYLQRLGALDDDQAADIHEEAKELIAAAVVEMEALDFPGVEILFDYVYASERPVSLTEGLDELRSIERRPEVKPLGPQPGASTGDADAPPEDA